MTIAVRPRFASDFPGALSALDIGLRDLVETAALTGRIPEIHLITVSIENVRPMVMDLSAEINRSLPGVAAEARRVLDTISTEADPG